MLERLTIATPTTDTLAAHLRVLTTAVPALRLDASHLVDLSSHRFLNPLLVLPLASMISESGCSWIPPNDAAARSYLDRVGFPNGFASVTTLPGSSYIPVAALPCTDRIAREPLENRFLELVLDTVGPAGPNAKTAISYPILELLTNAYEHSASQHGWIFAQAYPRKRYIDVCLLDRGRGLRQSYYDDRGVTLDDQTAVKYALKGESASGDEGRGYGVYTSMRVVVEAMGGRFLLISGSAGLYAKDAAHQNIFTTSSFSWPGVLVAMRIPFPTGHVDITPYLQ